ncbi:hypothetical protein [Sorangium sp. So ce1097]
MRGAGAPGPRGELPQGRRSAGDAGQRARPADLTPYYYYYYY